MSKARQKQRKATRSEKPQETPESRLHLGDRLREQGKYEAARNCYEKALQMRPNFPEAQLNMSACWHATGNFQQAILCCEAALRQRPNVLEIYLVMSDYLRDMGKVQEAVCCCEKVLRERPDDVAALNNMGLCLRATGNLQEATIYFEKALSQQPNHVEVLNNLGLVLHDDDKFEAALDCFERALRQNPEYPEALNNLGDALRELGKPEAALDCFKRTLRMRPDFPEAHTNIGVLLHDEGKITEALEHYNRALTHSPENQSAVWGKSLALLALGEYREGWKLHEKGFGHRHMRGPDQFPAIKLWDGKPAPDTHLLIWNEYGLGDALQFIRYAELCKQRVGAVSIMCPKPLVRLFKALPFIDDVFDTMREGSSFDECVPMMSLPHRFDSALETVPATIPYLRVDPEIQAKWATRFAGVTDAKVGLVWAGGVRKGNTSSSRTDRQRSVELERMKPWLDLKGVRFYNLQKDKPAEQIVSLGLKDRIVDFMGDVTDFADTAAIIQNLDLVITVDTSVAHLAGGLGKPVWILSRYNACWRWLQNRPTSPWYPTARIFGQPTLGDWDTVMAEVGRELANEIARKSAVRTTDFVGEPGPLLNMPSHQPFRQNAPDPVARTVAEAAAHHQAGRLAEAERLYRIAIGLAPRHGDALRLLGRLYVEQGKPAQAMSPLQAALQAQPNNPETLFFLGSALRQQGKPEAALEAFTKALQALPNLPEVYVNMGACWHDMNNLKEAVLCLEKALSQRPDYFDALSDLGTVLRNMGRSAEARAKFERALQIAPDNAVIITKLGALLHDEGKIDEALKHFNRALAHAPECQDALWQKSFALLALGEYREGWKLFETGIGQHHMRGLMPFAAKSWDGKPAPDKHLVIWAEQGLGDVLQFIRYAELCKQRVGKVSVVCPKPLVRLFKALPFIDDALDAPRDGSHFDEHVLMMSLPQRFDTVFETVPATLPYLRVDPEIQTKWAAKFAGVAGMKVGLVWAGGIREGKVELNFVDQQRSIGLERMKPWFDLQGARFYSLQKDKPAEQIAALGVTDRITDFMGEVTDFADTAAIIQNLDLVITVDTSVAHLAGGLGKPVWILSRYNADWRWLQNRPTNPWYPTARIFGQPTLGDWDTVMAEVGRELANEIAKMSAVRATDFVGEPDPLTCMPRHQPFRHNAPDPAARPLAKAIEHHRAGRFAEAEQQYRVALALAPRHGDALNFLGNLHLQSGKPEQAVPLLQAALQVQPKNLAILNNLGIVLRDTDRDEEAATCFRQALEIDPACAEALNNLGTVLQNEGKSEAALDCFEQAIRQKPNYVEALSNLGAVLWGMGRNTDARAKLERALQIEPNRAELITHLGEWAMCEGKISEALEHYNRALTHAPEYCQALFGKSIALLTFGRFREGWNLYETGIGDRDMRGPMPIPAKPWDGQAAPGKHLLIWSEQGLGDSLQFIRYAELCKKRFHKVSVLTEKPLVRLFSAMPFIDEAFDRTRGGNFHADEHVSMMSLPHRFDTVLEAVPAATPYLRVDPEIQAKWAARFAGVAGAKIGLVWAGGSHEGVVNARLMDQQRSVGLERMKPWLDLQGARFYSLQKDKPAEQIAALGLAERITDFMDEVVDFADTAAIVQNLDLVITVDTSVAHLAGGLGKPVWILSRYNADWRWLQNRPTNPWYPTARIFGQPMLGDWDSVMVEVGRELAQEIAKKSSPITTRFALSPFRSQ
jgi:tetratricopeptide (TPR) repeat protein/ADP-heptose:LPS heptosyltransferase